MRLVLASGSARRAELIERLGLRFEVEPTDVDESRLPDEPPAGYVERLARAKALAVRQSGVVAIGADTVVVFEGRILGKPGHPEEARGMLRRLQGERHEVFTGIAVASEEGVASAVETAEVVFLPMTEIEIDDYVDSGEPMDKAGAYALQGKGGRFVESVHGSPYTVIGLPVHLLARLLDHVGSDIREFDVDR